MLEAQDEAADATRAGKLDSAANRNSHSVLSLPLPLHTVAGGDGQKERVRLGCSSLPSPGTRPEPESRNDKLRCNHSEEEFVDARSDAGSDGAVEEEVRVPTSMGKGGRLRLGSAAPPANAPHSAKENFVAQERKQIAQEKATNMMQVSAALTLCFADSVLTLCWHIESEHISIVMLLSMSSFAKCLLSESFPALRCGQLQMHLPTAYCVHVRQL